MTYTCGHCGEEFRGSTHGNAQNKFCSENCRKRFWENTKYRHKCACGTVIYKRYDRCDECYRQAVAESHRERDEQIVAWWTEGLSMREICLRLGWTKGHLGQEIDRLRSRGFDLPYRYARGKKFPRCQKVAA